jgi:hypothetical protein
LLPIGVVAAVVVLVVEKWMAFYGSRTWNSQTWNSRTWSLRTWSSRTWNSLTWSSRTWHSRTWSLCMYVVKLLKHSLHQQTSWLRSGFSSYRTEYNLRNVYRGSCYDHYFCKLVNYGRTKWQFSHNPMLWLLFLRK